MHKMAGIRNKKKQNISFSTKKIGGRHNKCIYLQQYTLKIILTNLN